MLFHACSLTEEGGANVVSGGGGTGGGGVGGAGGVGGGWPDASSGGGGALGGAAGTDASDGSGGQLDASSDAQDAMDAEDATDAAQDASDAPVVWKPGDLANCALWLDAADTATVSLGGKSVDSWKDKCGNGDAKANGNQRPEYVPMSGKHAVRFDGVDDQLEIGGTSTSAAEYSLFFVVTKTFVAPLVRPVWSNRHLSAPLGGTPTYLGFNGVLDVFQDAVTPPSLPGKTNFNGQVVSILYEYAVSGTGAREVLYNEKSEAQGVGSNLTTNIPVGFIAFDGPIGVHSQIDVYEIVMYTRLLSAGERASVRAGLKNKWGLY